jgi:hypothetical protein
MAKSRNRTNRTPKKVKKPGRKPSTPDWADKFLENLAGTGVVGLAAKLTPIGCRTVYDRRSSDDVFKAGMDDAIAAASVGGRAPSGSRIAIEHAN